MQVVKKEVQWNQVILWTKMVILNILFLSVEVK